MGLRNGETKDMRRGKVLVRRKAEFIARVVSQFRGSGVRSSVHRRNERYATREGSREAKCRIYCACRITVPRKRCHIQCSSRQNTLCDSVSDLERMRRRVRAN
jgi:hypothetical protein